MILNVKHPHDTATDLSMRLQKLAGCSVYFKIKDGGPSFTTGDAINYKNSSELIGWIGLPLSDFLGVLIRARYSRAFLASGADEKVHFLSFMTLNPSQTTFFFSYL